MSAWWWWWWWYWETQTLLEMQSDSPFSRPFLSCIVAMVYLQLVLFLSANTRCEVELAERKTNFCTRFIRAVAGILLDCSCSSWRSDWLWEMPRRRFCCGVYNFVVDKTRRQPATASLRSRNAVCVPRHCLTACNDWSRPRIRRRLS